MAELPDQLLPEDAVDLAAQSALDDPYVDTQDDEVEAVEPLGVSWAFNWEEGRFIRRGGAPVETRGTDTLVQWLEMARRTARGAHPQVFSEEFGMDNPDDWMGVVDVVEAAADYGKRLEDAWLVHDRIAAVENYEAHWHRDEQIIHVHQVDVVLDDEESVSVSGPGPLIIHGTS